ncbi:MAG: hypothetical protein JW829_06700 [Pirellulales bacterium]|nr:hypothetical protein [Pirellulales bacterium]
MSVNLGEFRIREPRPIENQKIDIQFAIQAVVRQADKKRVEKFISQQQNTIRDQIILAVRSADSPEFDEPQLVMLRHRILLRLADMLGERLIQDLYVTDYHCQID